MAAAVVGWRREEDALTRRAPQSCRRESVVSRQLSVRSARFGETTINDLAVIKALPHAVAAPPPAPRTMVALPPAAPFAVPVLATLHTRVPGTRHATLFE